MRKSTTTLIKYLSELLIVAFGVFLGIIVSDWKTQRDIGKNTERAISYIKDEISDNISALETSLDYQTIIRSKMDSLQQQIDASSYGSSWLLSHQFRFNQLADYHGPGFPNLSNIMYESAMLNGTFQELSIVTTQLISGLYKQQDQYSTLKMQLEDRLTNINSGTTVIDVVAIWELARFDGLAMEQQLLAEMKSVLAQLNE